MKLFKVFTGISVLLVLLCFARIPVMAASTEAYDEAEIESRADERYEDAEERLNKIYRNAVAKAKEATYGYSRQDTGNRLFRWFYQAYYTIRSVAVYIGGFSILLGGFLCWLVKHNKYLLRKIFFTTVVGIPGLLVIVCFGIGILIG